MNRFMAEMTQEEMVQEVLDRELQAYPGRYQLRLSNRRDRCHGTGWCREYLVP